MQFKDYHTVLSVACHASADDIKRACCQLARPQPSDVRQEPDAATSIAEVNAVHAIPSDAERRAACDALDPCRQADERLTPKPDGETCFEFSGPASEGIDFFAELFGRMGHPARPTRARARYARAAPKTSTTPRRSCWTSKTLCAVRGATCA